MSLRIIPLRQLWSTKRSIEFRDARGQTAGDSFFILVELFRSGSPVAPIEVTPQGIDYVILDGVHRALAALAAGYQSIEAYVLPRSSIGYGMGHAIPLDRVLFPNDLRGSGK